MFNMISNKVLMFFDLFMCVTMFMYLMQQFKIYQSKIVM